MKPEYSARLATIEEHINTMEYDMARRRIAINMMKAQYVRRKRALRQLRPQRNESTNLVATRSSEPMACCQR